MRRTALKRKGTLARRTAVRKRRPGPPRRSSRVRDPEFLAFVHTLCCSVIEEWPDFPNMPGPCDGPLEADHDSRGRGFGQKSSDNTCIPLCKRHHAHRQNRTGVFKNLSREQANAWFDRAQLRTRTLYAERNGETIV